MQKLAVLLLLALAPLASHAAAVDASELVVELAELRDKSKDGVLSFNDDALKRFASAKKRGYSLYIFLNARQVQNEPTLAIGKLRQEFGLLAAAARAGPAPDSAFFAEVVFEDAPRIFHAVQAQQVPYIFRLSPERRVTSQGELAIPDNEKLTFKTGGGLKYPWTAEDMLGFFRKVGLQAADIERPSLLKSKYFPALVLGTLGALLAVARLAWALGAFHHPLPYAVVCLAVFWFSVSGGMYNIIRGMPMFIRDKNGRLQFFLTGRSGQLGAEGFIVGTGYIIFSACIAMLTFAAPRVRNKVARQWVSLVLVAGAGYMAMRIYLVFQAKTGYRISSYLLR